MRCRCKTGKVSFFTHLSQYAAMSQWSNDAFGRPYMAAPYWQPVHPIPRPSQPALFSNSGRSVNWRSSSNSVSSNSSSSSRSSSSSSSSASPDSSKRFRKRASRGRSARKKRASRDEQDAHADRKKRLRRHDAAPVARKIERLKGESSSAPSRLDGRVLFFVLLAVGVLIYLLSRYLPASSFINRGLSASMSRLTLSTPAEYNPSDLESDSDDESVVSTSRLRRTRRQPHVNELRSLPSHPPPGQMRAAPWRPPLSPPPPPPPPPPPYTPGVVEIQELEEPQEASTGVRKGREIREVRNDDSDPDLADPVQVTIDNEHLHPLSRARQKIEKVSGRKRSHDGRQKKRLHRPAPQSEHRPNLDMTKAFEPGRMAIFRVPGDGNCLFYCLRQVLRSLDVIQNVYFLRTLVARSIDQEKFEFLKEIYTSAKEAGDYRLMRDYAFVEGAETLMGLRKRILTTAYYGDEMALRAFESKYHIKCLVIQTCDGGRTLELTRKLDDAADLDSYKWFTLLYLDQDAQHYELIRYDENDVLTREELPRKIQKVLDAEERIALQRKRDKEAAEAAEAKREKEAKAAPTEEAEEAEEADSEAEADPDAALVGGMRRRRRPVLFKRATSEAAKRALNAFSSRVAQHSREERGRPTNRNVSMEGPVPRSMLRRQSMYHS
jgi:hypothetical protein